MKAWTARRRFASFSACALAGLLTGCGDGLEVLTQTDPSKPPILPAVPLGSTVLDMEGDLGRVGAARVTAYRVNGGVAGPQIGQGITDEDGRVQIDLGTYTGPVIVELTAQPGGQTKFADEATDSFVSLPADFKLRSAFVVAEPLRVGTRVEVSVTPYSDLAHSLAIQRVGGLSPANVRMGAEMVNRVFGFDPIYTRPVRFERPPPEGSTFLQKQYALHNAAVSRLAQDGECRNQAADQGSRMRCAIDQLRNAFVVAPPKGASEAVVRVENTATFEALALAMKSMTTARNNQTGITEDHRVVRGVVDRAQAFKAGEGTTITVATDRPDADTTTKARRFFENLRSNAAALEAGAAEEALTVPLRDFADAVRGDAQAVPSQVADLVELADTGRRFWSRFKAGESLFPLECAAFEGTFPSSVAAPRVLAQSAASATYVGCVEWSAIGVTTASGFSSQQTRTDGQFVLLLNFGGASGLTNVPYVAGKRLATFDLAARADQEPVSSVWRSAQDLSGRVGFRLGSAGELEGFSMKGDLPPALSQDGAMRALADRYTIDLSGSVAEGQNGLTTVSLDSGSLGVVPVGGGAVRTTFDLSPAGATSAILAQDPSDESQVDASRITLAARISNPSGEVNGRLVVDRFVNRASLPGATDLSARVTFSGDLSLAGKGKILRGTLSVDPATSQPDSALVRFSGALNLPDRPSAQLEDVEVAIVDDEVSRYSGTYAQAGLTVRFSGQGSGPSRTVSFDAVEDAVSMTAIAGQNLIEVKVGGTKAAEIDQRRSRINYIDGTFESVL